MPSPRIAIAPLAILFGLLASIWVLRTVQPSEPNPSPFLTTAETLDDLTQLYTTLDPASDEAARVQRAIEKVREKEARKHARFEQPGILIEAMAELKTTRQGARYRPNYKVQALEASLQRVAGKKADVLPWVERGPGNVSGRVRAVIVDKADASGNTWFAATIGGGVWKTTDAGVTWENKTPDLPTLTTATIAQSTSNPDILYVGTGMGYGRVVDLEGSGIFKSIDHGETWTQLASTANGELLEAINRIVIDPENPDIVVVCSNDSFSHLGVEEGPRKSGIFRTTDGGATWTQVFDANAFFGPETDNRVQQIIANPNNFNLLYASVNEVGVIRSLNAGVSWSVSADDFALPSDIGNPSSDGFGLAGISVRTELAIAPSDPSRLYAAVERPRGVADLYISSDSGRSWSLVEDSGNDPNWFNSAGRSGADGAYVAGWFDNTIAVHPFDKNIVYVGGVNMYRIVYDPTTTMRSTEPIAWWIPNGASIPVVHADHHFLAMILDGGDAFRILNANDGGVAFSTDGGDTWTERRGMITSQFYGVDKKPGEQQYIGGTQDNGTWLSGLNPDTDDPWRFVIGGDGFEAVWNHSDPNLLLGGSQFNRLRRSTNGGQSWSLTSAAAAGNGPFITKIANSKADPDLVFAIGSEGVLRSDNFGESWTLTPITSNWIGYRPFDNVEVSNADPQVVWISSRLDVDPPSGLQGGIHVSNDGGLSFTHISQNLPAELREASGIATDPVDPETAYLLFAGPGEPKVMRTRDLGQTWEDLSGFGGTAKQSIPISSNGFPDVAAFALLAMPYNTDILWAGTEVGLFISNNGGQTWEPANNGFPNVAIFELSIADDEVLVATQGRGIWTVQLPELAGFTPPVATRSPRLRELAMLPTGVVSVTIGLPSAYDSTHVLQDDAIVRLSGNETAIDTTISVPVLREGTATYEVVSYKEGRAFRSPPQTIDIFPAVARYSYTNDFLNPAAADDFTGNGFSIASVSGFNSPAIHSDHPYGQEQDFIYMLKSPIIVGSSDAIMTYDDVVLVEEGRSANYLDPGFYDYVIVEGTSDGVTWEALAPGYDSSFDPAWSTAYNAGIEGSDSSTPGDESLFVSHRIDLLDTFEPGDTIFIRFRLFSDPLAVGWGWAIDNIVIQPNVTSSDPEPTRPQSTRLEANYPNPFAASTTIPFSLDRESRVTLEIFDIQGRRLYSLIQNQSQTAGRHQILFTPGELASGVYFVRLTAHATTSTAPPFTETRSLTIQR